MIIAGIQKTSLIDFPRKICTVLFTRGCNFFCGFCHNPELVIIKQYLPRLSQKEIFEYLKKRKKVIEAVVITGGEPTIHKDLPAFIAKIKKIGYLVKLDTNGTNPSMLRHLLDLKLLDYIAMDIKNSPRKYQKTTSRIVNLDKVKKSVKIIMGSGIDYEFRTTVVPGLHTTKDFESIGKWLAGAKRFYLQKFRPTKTLNPTFQKLKPFTLSELSEFKIILSKYIKKISIR